MIAARSLRFWKCSVARRIACSKSGCSKSFMSAASLGLPVTGVSQSGEQSELESRKGNQRIAQAAQRPAVFPELFADSADHRSDARGLRSCNSEQALEAPFLRKQHDGAADGLFRRQLARPARPAQEVEQRRIAFREAGPCFGSARMDDGIAANEFSR